MRTNIWTAFEQLAAHGMRSILTSIGIAIAVASTISIVGIVRGMNDYVMDFLQDFGTNAMWAWPERPEGEAGRLLNRITMTEADVAAVRESCPAVRHASPLVRRPIAKLRVDSGEVSVPLEGVSVGYPAIRNFAVDAGRPLGDLDVEQGHHVCVLGREALRKLGADDGILGQALSIDGHRFRVVGLLKTKGSFFGVDQDDIVLIPYTSALKLYPAMRQAVAFAAQAVSEDAVPEAKAQIAYLLRQRHGLEAYQPNDFQVRTQDEVLTIFQRLSVVTGVVLLAIVAISLLVGGIGIMNVMLVGVTEGTREIGLRKTVGARRRDILVQFLAEAMVLSMLGGGLGIGLGYAICALASLHPRMVDVVVPWWAVTTGFGVSAGTGIVFGLVPAIKAALLNPIDALRHE